jgi:hypothetical protein
MAADPTSLPRSQSAGDEKFNDKISMTKSSSRVLELNYNSQTSGGIMSYDFPGHCPKYFTLSAFNHLWHNRTDTYRASGILPFRVNGGIWDVRHTFHVIQSLKD